MSETTGTKKSGGIGATVKGCLNGFKAAPTSTKIVAGAVSALLTAGGFVVGRASKKGKK